MEKAESAPGAGKPSLTHVDTCLCCDDTSDTHGDDKCEGEEDRSHGVYLFLRSRHVPQLHDGSGVESPLTVVLNDFGGKAIRTAEMVSCHGPSKLLNFSGTAGTPRP